MATTSEYSDSLELTDQTGGVGLGAESRVSEGGKTRASVAVLGANAALLLLALVMGLGARTWYTRTPQYSVAKLQTAARERDRLTLARYLDSRPMAEALADAGVGKVQSAAPEPLDGVVGNMGGLARPLVVKAIDERLTDSLMGRVSGHESSLWSRLGSASVSVESAGDTATVTFSDDLAEVPLVLVMRRQGDHWRAVALGNADAVVAESWDQWAPTQPLGTP